MWRKRVTTARIGLAPRYKVDPLYHMWYGHSRESPNMAELKRHNLMTRKKGRIGTSFEDYLAEQGSLDETRAIAVKRVLVWQLEQAMEERQMSKSAMAREMRTSRSQLDRILDPDNDRIRLDTLAAAANVLGLNLRIDLIG